MSAMEIAPTGAATSHSGTRTMLTTLRASETSGRLFESAMRAIREYTLNSGPRAGDPLPPEGRLAQELGISRTSTREALKALESLGVVRVRTGAGVFVRPFSFDAILDNLASGTLSDRSSILELLRVRQQLVAGFVAQAAVEASPERLRVPLRR
jgi:DNA-binding FadR family transcriptional regulator